MKVALRHIKHTEPRREHGDMASLKASIREVGLIHPPTVDENLNLLAGRRRYHALMELYGPNYEVDVMVLPVNGDRLKAFRVALAENLERKPLTDPENRAAIAAYDELKREIEGERKPGGVGGVYSTVINGQGWSQIETARELGISQPSVSQAIAAEEIVKARPELAAKKTKQILRVVKVEALNEAIKELKAPTGLYDVIVIDPPWEMTGEGAYDPDRRRVVPPYPTLTIDEMQALALPTASDCIVWLWAINNRLHDALHLLEAWGFEFKNVLTWVKNTVGTGNWLRGQTEHCLLAVKGKPPFLGYDSPTVLFGPRREHSRKPDEFYALVEKTCGGRKLDYFGCQERVGWDTYGTPSRDT